MSSSALRSSFPRRRCLQCCCRLHSLRSSPLISTASTTRRRFSTAKPTSAPSISFSSWPQVSSSRQFSSSSAFRFSNHTSNPSSSTSSTSQPAPPSTHYDLFPESLPQGPPPNGPFPIDTRALRREFLRLQARAHPDMHPASSKARAEATSALINDAYKTLSNPLLRAQYLLSLRGVDVANDETLKVEEPELLMVVLEAREEIEDAETEEELKEPREVNEERIRGSEEILGEAFRADDMDDAKREAVRLRYWVNIRESLDNWEPGKPIVLQH